jgi:hypothetical protein
MNVCFDLFSTKCSLYALKHYRFGQKVFKPSHFQIQPCPEDHEYFQWLVHIRNENLWVSSYDFNRRLDS